MLTQRDIMFTQTALQMSDTSHEEPVHCRFESCPPTRMWAVAEWQTRRIVADIDSHLSAKHGMVYRKW